MADTPRKTLSLPVKATGDNPSSSARRKPLRTGGPQDKRKVVAPPAPAQPAPATAKPWLARPTAAKPPAKPPAKARAPEAPAPRRRPVSAPPPPAPGSIRAETPPQMPPPASTTTPQAVRISKLMSVRGLCSRREADAYIERGWVYVDGERVSELGSRALPTARITLDKAAQANQQRQMTILLHKPVGYVSGQPEPGFKPAIQLIQPENQQRSPDTPLFHPAHLKNLAPAGRLDIDSTGLLVLTQDGRVARQLIGESSQIDKEYLVRVEGRLDERGLALLNHGLSLDDKQLKPARVEWLNADQLRFVLHEGRKRQIRRMCELVGLKVIGLKRVRMGRVRLGDLPLGQWRYLREDEVF